jgi:DNA polymerase IV
VTRSRWVLHVDLDQFIAAVEIQRHPELGGRPVVVGGDGDPRRARQVVATASYEAREFGVRSGMPLRRAQALCPDAVFLPSDPDTYRSASDRVMDSLRRLPIRVEVLGWDEAFVGTDDDPQAVAERIRRAVWQDTGLSCSVGIGDNKLRAKTATELAKPGGIAMLTRLTWMEVMGSRPTDALWGVGRKTAARLAVLGIATVADLAEADEDVLAERFGPATGPWLRALGQGRGSRVVDTEPWVPRSRSHETTYPADITDPAAMRADVHRLAARVAAEVIGDGRAVTRVEVKVRFAPFLTRTRVTTLPEATDDPEVVVAAADAVLDRFDLDRPVRLLGVRAELA